MTEFKDDSIEATASLPKVDLHRHLEGSLRLSTLLEVVRSEGLNLPSNKSDLRQLVQVSPEDDRSSSNFLSKFLVLRNFFLSRDIIQRFVGECIEDAVADHVRHLELQFTPVALAQVRDFPLDEVIDWVIETAKSTSEREGISVGLIPSVNRHESTDIAEVVARMAVDRMGDGVVGLGLAGNEVEFSAEPFEGIFIDTQAAGLPTTIHAGEWTGAETVRHALLNMNADRISHGIRVMENKEVVAIAKERRTVFEVCLSSNLDSGVIARMSDHPLPAMIQSGLRVTLNTDDPSVSGITLTEDYELAQQELGFSITSLKGIIMTAAQSAFLDAEERKGLELELHAEFF